MPEPIILVRDLMIIDLPPGKPSTTAMVEWVRSTSSTTTTVLKSSTFTYGTEAAATPTRVEVLDVDVRFYTRFTADCRPEGFNVIFRILHDEEERDIGAYLLYARSEGEEPRLVATQLALPVPGTRQPNVLPLRHAAGMQEGVRYYSVRVLDRAGREHGTGEEMEVVLTTETGCSCSAAENLTGRTSSFGCVLSLLLVLAAAKRRSNRHRPC